MAERSDVSAAGRTWLESVEAAVDAFDEAAQAWGYCDHDPHDREPYDAARAALIALVTRGRCPVCGGHAVTVPEALDGGYGCTECEWTREDRDPATDGDGT